MEETGANGREIADIVKYNRWVNRRINQYMGAGFVSLLALIYWLVS